MGILQAVWLFLRGFFASRAALGQLMGQHPSRPENVANLPAAGDQRVGDELPMASPADCLGTEDGRGGGGGIELPAQHDGGYNARESPREGSVMSYSTHRPKGYEGQGDSPLPRIVRQFRRALAETDRTMVGLLSLVTFGEETAYHVIPGRQDPQVCSGFGRAESRWTTTALRAFERWRHDECQAILRHG